MSLLREQVKGIRVKSLRLFVLLMVKYCTGFEEMPFIDFYSRYGHTNTAVVVDKLEDVVKLFVEKEGMSRRKAYDYARAIQQIQFLTS
jgi:hypothetical protein